MGIPFYSLEPSQSEIASELNAAIQRVIDKSLFIGGEEVEKFEEAFSGYLGVNNCVSCGNGSDALELILKAMEIGVNDEVIVPSHSWIATASAVSNVGAEPIFVDCIEFEYTIDVTQIEAAITPKTKAIIAVHLYGLPSRIKEISQLAKKYGLYFIEDCAQAHGAEYLGQKVGGFGDAAAFSFYPTKNLGALGDGGAIVTDNPDIAQRCKLLRQQGVIEKNDHEIIGRNSKMDTLQAAILSVKLKYLDHWNAQRTEIAGWYQEFLNDKVTVPFVPEVMVHVYHLYVILCENRSIVLNRLEMNDVGYSIHYPTPLPFLKPYDFKNHTAEDFPLVSSYFQKLVSLPMYPGLKRNQAEFVSGLLIN